MPKISPERTVKFTCDKSTPNGSSVALDAWLRAYRVTANTTFTVTSAGEGGTFGDTDDLSITVDFTPVRREKTLDSLRVINQAIVLYNATYQATNPLPATWSTARNMLILRRYLPAGSAYLKDGWNQNFTADPAPKVKLFPTNRMLGPVCACSATTPRTTLTTAAATSLMGVMPRTWRTLYLSARTRGSRDGAWVQ